MLAQRLGLSAAELEEERRVRQEQMEHITQLLRAQAERERAQASGPPNSTGPRQAHAKEKHAGEGDVGDGTEGEIVKEVGEGAGMVGAADGNENGNGPVEEKESESGGAEAGAIDQVTEQLRLYGI